MQPARTSLPLLAALLLAAAAQAAEEDKPELEVKMTGYETCEGAGELANMLKDPGVRRISKKEMAVSGQLVVTKVAGEGDLWEGRFLVEYEEACGNAQTRKVVADFPIANMCECIKGQDYQEFFECIPGINRQCPMNTGEFEIKDYIVDPSKLEGAAPGCYIITVEEKINSALTSCIVMSLEVSQK